MYYSFFDRQNLTDAAIVDVKEEFINKPKTKELLCPEESCDDFFKTLHDRIKEIKHTENPNAENIFEEIPECNFILKRINILGEYYSKTRTIKYYPQTPQTIEVVKIHERFHAIHHLMPDDKNQIWDNFAKVEPFYIELLAQLFTFIYIRDIEKSPLDDFNELNRHQPVIYQTYKMFKDYGQREAIDLYWMIRKGDKTDPLLKALNIILCHINSFHLNSLQSQIENKLVETLTFICKNPSIFVSEADVQYLVMRNLMTICELDPDKQMYDTNCTIGKNKRGKISHEKYQTILMHKEYGHQDLHHSRSDIVILNPCDIKLIDDPISLKRKGKWLTPDYIFEIGTEKSASGVNDFINHLKGDYDKVKKANKQGYIIHVQRNYQRLAGNKHDKNVAKWDDYVAKFNTWIDSVTKVPQKEDPKIIVIQINIGVEERNMSGKIKILKDPYTKKSYWKPINLKDVSANLKSLFA